MMDAFALWFGRLAVTAFFAIAFLQSAADKWIDSKGNLEFLTGHFGSSPLRGLVSPMFWGITVLESVAGALAAIGVVQILIGAGVAMALWGIVLSVVSLLCLFFGQRLAKDYAGAVVLTSYFAVALLGLMLLGYNPET
jgi:hypothetical protein